MSKLFQQFKKLISGFTAVILMASIITPNIAFAAVPVVTVDDLETNDTTPVITGTVDDATSTVTVSVAGGTYVDNTIAAGGAWSITTTPINIDGDYPVSVVANNVDGDSLEASGLLTIDTVAPIVSGVLNNEYYNTNVVPVFTEGTGVLNYTGASEAFVSGTLVSIEDSYTLEVTDTAGNTSTVSFVIDKTAPVITLNGADPQIVERGTAYVELGATADTGEGVVSTGSVDTATIGDYTFSYDAIDLAGNSAVTVERTVTVQDTASPSVDAGKDVTANTASFQDATASDFPFAISSYLWEQVSGPGTVVFAPDAMREDLLLSADVDGDYVLKLTATDAGGNSAEDTMVLTWDNAVNIATNLVTTPGNAKVTLGWTNPADKDLKAVNIYRSTSVNFRGVLVANLATNSETFVDTGLVNGRTYYYSLETVDALGNTAITSRVAATPKAPEVAVVASSAPVSYQYYDNNIVADDSSEVTEDKEVKSDETQKDDAKTETSDSDVPMVGIIILILLIALGLYLLYLQNPEMFSKLAFWNKNKKGSMTIGPKKTIKNKNTKSKK